MRHASTSRLPTSAHALGLARIVVFSLWLYTVLSRPMWRWAELPTQLFYAPGPLRLLPDAFWPAFLQPGPLLAFQAALAVGCALVTLGVRPHAPLAVATCALLVLYEGTVQGFNGYINHASVALLYSAMLLALFPAADACSVVGESRSSAPAGVYAAGMTAPAVLLTLGYAFIGTHRLVVGGHAVFTGDAIVTYLGVTGNSPGRFGLLPTLYPWTQPIVKLGFAITTLVEIAAPLVLLQRHARAAWVVFILGFHVSTYLMMNILFWQNIGLIVVFLTPAPYLALRLATAVRRRLPWGAAEGPGDPSGAGRPIAA